MSVINSIPLIAAGDDGYQINRSVRLRSSASAYFNRTFGTPTSATTFTFSTWMKRGKLGAGQTIIGASVAQFDGLYFNTSDQIVWYVNGIATITTTAVFRDPSAWYHIVLKTSGTSSVLYVNNVQVGTGSVAAVIFNTAILHIIGQNSSTNFFDGYLTEVNFIDGQALTPSSFGETDVVTGVWKPKKYAGTYGTNGFYLNFSDNSAATAAAIGKDNSGNGNNWTPNNISVTAGATYDSMLDVPTPYADGGNGRGNYAVLNPLHKSSGVTVADGNLAATGTSYPHNILSSIAFPSSGKFYAELFSSTATNASIGIGFGVQSAAAGVNADYNAAGSYKFYASASAYVVSNGTATAISSGYTNSANQTFKIAADVDSGKVWIGQNSGWWDAAGGLTGNPSTGANPTFTVAIADFFVVAHFNSNGSFTWTANFGQRAFALTPPTGFKALNTQNLPDATIKKGNAYFDATLYTGNASTLAVTNSGFQPDFVWMKNRASSYYHGLYDSVRGTGTSKSLYSNATDAEGANSTNQNLVSFDASGFTLGSTSSTNAINTSGQSHVAWQWKAGGTAVSNTSGSITSSVSASTTAGFSVVTYTGNEVAGATVGHGLGVAPSMIIIKRRDGTAVDWAVYHASIGATKYLTLNSTAAEGTSSAYWNNTAPTSSVFSLYNSGATNANPRLYVAYCFAAVKGYSAFGSYTGNNSTDGPFVYCGFRPRFVLIKDSSAVGYWVIYDSSRDTYNVVNEYLQPQSSAAAFSTYAQLDLLSNGFKIRQSNATSGQNHLSGNTYIYAAFAENPFKNSLAR